VRFFYEKGKACVEIKGGFSQKRNGRCLEIFVGESPCGKGGEKTTE